MHVLFVEPQPCIRALKYAEGIRSLYPNITLSFAYSGKSLTGLYGHGDEHFANLFPLGPDPESALARIAAGYHIDLIHSHNAPDTLTNTCLDLFGGKVPIIHDIHDLMTARDTAYEDGVSGARDAGRWQQEERRAIEDSNAVIAVSEEILAIARDHGYRMPPITFVYPNHIPARFVPAVLPPREANHTTGPVRVVYEGFLSSNGSHYDLREIFRTLAAEGIQVHIYPSRPNPDYIGLTEATPNLVLHEPLPPETLFEEITQYDFGWAGYNRATNQVHLNTVMPNKLFEYIACGLPVISFPHSAMARFLETHGLGLVIEDIAGIAGRLRGPQIGHLQNNVLRRRHDFTVEARLPAIIEIYEQLVGSPLQGVANRLASPAGTEN